MIVGFILMNISLLKMIVRLAKKMIKAVEMMVIFGIFCFFIIAIIVRMMVVISKVNEAKINELFIL